MEFVLVGRANSKREVEELDLDNDGVYLPDASNDAGLDL